MSRSPMGGGCADTTENIQSRFWTGFIQGKPYNQWVDVKQLHTISVSDTAYKLLKSFTQYKNLMRRSIMGNNQSRQFVIGWR